jgi:hypothetical protein
MFNLSLPNNRNDLLKEALSWLSDASGKLVVTPESVNHALQGATWWRPGRWIPKRAGGAIA